MENKRKKINDQESLLETILKPQRMDFISLDWVCKSALANSCKMELLVHSFKECASSISERNLLQKKLKREIC